MISIQTVHTKLNIISSECSLIMSVHKKPRVTMRLKNKLMSGISPLERSKQFIIDLLYV